MKKTDGPVIIIKDPPKMWSPCDGEYCNHPVCRKTRGEEVLPKRRETETIREWVDRMTDVQKAIVTERLERLFDQVDQDV